MNRQKIHFPLLFALLVGAAACTTGDLALEGRPCANSQACGPGTTCDPVTNTCVAGATVKDAALKDMPGPDAALKDGPLTDADQGPSLDLLLPDQLQPDQFIKPDGGCPSGLTSCGSVCVDLKKNLNHCGACNNKCPGATSDSCVNGTCGCGTSSSSKPAPCANRLNCVSGKCTCLKGGLCQGCCQNNTCYKTAAQSASMCGNGGATCAACSDNNVCTDDTCSSSGVCLNTPSKTTKTCDDKILCTHTDLCTSTGKCQGTSYTCSDGLSCTTDTCTGKAPALGSCTYTISSGSCAITDGSTKACYVSGAAKPGTSCFLCDSTKSQTSWTYPSNCTNYNRVSSVVPYGSIYTPRDVWVTSTGDVLVADSNYHVIRKISSTGVTVLAGAVGSYGKVDGTGTSARFNYPYSLTQDAYGNIYVADRSNHAIRRISTSGAVTTVAGSGTLGSTDGSALSARFNYPSGVTVDGNGAIFVADTSNNTIRRVYGGLVTTVAGVAGSVGSADGAGSLARFYGPQGITYQSSKIYVADTYNNKVRSVDLYKSYLVNTVAGTGSAGYLDGTTSTAIFNRPMDVSVTSSGRVYVVEYYGNRLRLIYGGYVSTLAGTGSYGYQDGPAISAKFRYPTGLHAVAVANQGWVYIADHGNRNIRLVKLTSSP